MSVYPITGRIYQHFKGNLYVVDGVAKNSETQEEWVEYHCCATGQRWVRPLEMWSDTVKLPEAPGYLRACKRFQLYTS